MKMLFMKNVAGYMLLQTFSFQWPQALYIDITTAGELKFNIFEMLHKLACTFKE